MKTFAMQGPSGPMTTMAETIEKAWNNLRARLHFQHGMSWFAAANYDHRDLHEVK